MPLANPDDVAFEAQLNQARANLANLAAVNDPRPLFLRILPHHLEPEIRGEPEIPAPLQGEAIGSIFNKEKQKLLLTPSNELVLADTDLGVEVEIEGVLAHALPAAVTPEIRRYWEWHEDQSLHDNGMEFTFKAPMFGVDCVNALKSLFALALAKKWKSSRRTGIHVHMDARDLTRSQLIGLIGYYLILEPVIYAWVGEDREQNSFCLPWYKAARTLTDAVDILTMMEQVVRTGDQQLQRTVIKNCEYFHKYAGLNLRSLAVFGSVEFRQLKTTFVYADVIKWINMLLSLKQAALQVPESTLVIVHEVERFGPAYVTCRIFGEDVLNKALQNNPDALSEVSMVGVPQCIEFLGALTFKKPEDWLEELKWKPDEERKEHPGMALWKAKTFPKGEILTKEEEKLAIKKPGARIGAVENGAYHRYFRIPNLDQILPVDPPEPPEPEPDLDEPEEPEDYPNEGE